MDIERISPQCGNPVPRMRPEVRQFVVGIVACIARGNVVVAQRIVDRLRMLVRIERRRDSRRVLPPHGDVVGELRRFHRTTLGRDQDDAVRGPGAVQGRRGAVLQYGNVVDVLRAESVKRELVAHDPVDHVQRIDVIEGAGGPNPDAGLTPRGAGILRDRRTGQPPRQRVGKVVDGHIAELRRIHAGNGPRYRAPVLHAVTRHDQCLELGRQCRQSNINLRPPVNRDVLGLIADEREMQRILQRRHAHRIASVAI